MHNILFSCFINRESLEKNGTPIAIILNTLKSWFLILFTNKRKQVLKERSDPGLGKEIQMILWMLYCHKVMKCSKKERMKERKEGREGWRKRERQEETHGE